MPIPLGNTVQTLPSLKFVEPGEIAKFVVIDIDEKVPFTEWNTGEQKTYDGKPLYQVMLTVRILPDTTAQVGTGKGDNAVRRPATPGEIVNLYIASHNKYDPSDPTHRTYAVAQKERGRIAVGDLGGARFERKQQGRGSDPKHIMAYAFRAPANAEELALRQEAEAEYVKRNPGTVLSEAPVTQSAADAGLI